MSLDSYGMHLNNEMNFEGLNNGGVNLEFPTTSSGNHEMENDTIQDNDLKSRIQKSFDIASLLTDALNEEKYHKKPKTSDIDNLSDSSLLGNPGFSDLTKTSNPRAVPAFLRKLFNMVDSPSTADFIHWSESGKSFIITESVEFAKQVLPRFFKHNNFSSFVRQLNLYGFHKIQHIKQGVLITDAESEQWEFSNPNFIQDQPQLLTKVTRHKAKDPDYKESNPINMIQLLKEISHIKKQQNSLSQHLKEIQTENGQLWRENSEAKELNRCQNETTQKILSFLASLFSASAASASHDKSNLPTEIVPKRRRLLLDPPVPTSASTPFSIDASTSSSTPTPTPTTPLPSSETTAVLPSTSIHSPSAYKSPDSNHPHLTINPKALSAVEKVVHDEFPNLHNNSQMQLVTNHLNGMYLAPDNIMKTENESFPTIQGTNENVSNSTNISSQSNESKNQATLGSIENDLTQLQQSVDSLSFPLRESSINFDNLDGDQSFDFNAFLNSYDNNTPILPTSYDINSFYYVPEPNHGNTGNGIDGIANENTSKHNYYPDGSL